MWPAVPVIGQRPPSDRVNVPTYGCFRRVQQCCHYMYVTVTTAVWGHQCQHETTRKIRYNILTLHCENFCMLLSQLGLACSEPQIGWNSHPGIRRASWIVKQSQWRSTNCYPYHANATGTSQRCQRRHRHKYIPPITHMADCQFSVKLMLMTKIFGISTESRDYASRIRETWVLI